MAFELKVQPLTRAAFAPFGEVIEKAGAHHYPINAGSCLRHHDLARVELGGAQARALVNIFSVAQAFALPLAVELVERHPLGSQAFIPQGEVPFLVVVAAADQEPVAENLRAFVSNGRQGVNYHTGVWHFPLTPLTADADFIVVDRGGPGHNCDEVHFAPGAIVVVA